MAPIDHSDRPVKPPGSVEAPQQFAMQPSPHAGRGPAAPPPPRRDARAADLETVRRTVCEAEATCGGQPGNRSPKWILSAARGAVQARLRCHLASARMIAR